jgi:hypothetical protein
MYQMHLICESGDRLGVPVVSLFLEAAFKSSYTINAAEVLLQGVLRHVCGRMERKQDGAQACATNARECAVATLAKAAMSTFCL